MNSVSACQECGSSSLIFDDFRGEVICSSCGIVADSNVVDTGPEWRAYDSYERQSKSRIGKPISLTNQQGLSTVISTSHYDSFGSSLSNVAQYKYRRLARINDQSQSKIARNLKNALIEIKRIKSHLGLSEAIAETSASIYRKALKKNLIRGRSVIAISSSSVYLACRQNRSPITLKEIADVSSLETKELGRYVRILMRNLNLANVRLEPQRLISSLGQKLDLTMPTIKQALSLFSTVSDYRLVTGKKPMSVAATLIYIASIQTGERRTQQQIAKIARTTPATIRNRFRELLDNGLSLDNFVVKRGAAARPVVLPKPF
jgi:transcription initiation factor TFIIB